MSDIALPSSALRNHVLAEWVHDERLTVDVRSGDELELAVAVGIHPSRMTLHADGLHESELRAAIALGPGRIVVSSMGQLHVLALAVGRRTQTSSGCTVTSGPMTTTSSATRRRSAT